MRETGKVRGPSLGGRQIGLEGCQSYGPRRQPAGCDRIGMTLSNKWSRGVSLVYEVS